MANIFKRIVKSSNQIPNCEAGVPIHDRIREREKPSNIGSSMDENELHTQRLMADVSPREMSESTLHDVAFCERRYFRGGRVENARARQSIRFMEACVYFHTCARARNDDASLTCSRTARTARKR